METRGSLSDFIKGYDAKLADVINQTIDIYKSDIDKVLKMETSDKAEETHYGKSNLTNFRLKTEGGTIHNGERVPTYRTNYVFKTYSNSIETTMEAKDDNDFRGAWDEARDIANAYMSSKDLHCAELFNKAFTTTYDANMPISAVQTGKPLASTAQPRADGGTGQSNAASDGVVLSETSLNTLHVKMLQILSDVGTPMVLGGKPLLVVPPALAKKAIEITQSNLQSGSADNTMNYYKGVIADVLVLNYLGAYAGGSDTAWFVVNPQTSELYNWTRQTIDLKTYEDPNTRSIMTNAVARWAIGFSDWRGFVGSKGDGQVYAG